MGTSNKNSCKTAAVMGLLGKGPAPEQDTRILPDRPRDIEAITSEILDAKRAGGEAILTIGRGLMEAKALLSHGEWLSWLENRVEFSERAAQRFMKLAREYSNPTTLSDLGASKALILLAIPDEDRDEFIEVPHVVGGEEKTVFDMSVRELKAVIKERDEALKAAELAKAEQSAAEQAREKLSQEMALANERIAGLNAEIEEQSAQSKKWQKEIARLEIDIAKQKNRPVDVAVEADPAAIEAARKEVEERMQAQLDEARKAQEKYRAQLQETNSALQRAKLEREETLIELKKVREQAEKAEKKATLTTDADMVLFSELYDQAQVQIKRMGGVRLKKKDKAPEQAEKLQAELMALIPLVKEAAGQ